MKFSARVATASSWVIFSCSFLFGCSSSGTTLLCNDFQSYETLQNVRTHLSRKNQTVKWNEEVQSTAPKDPRPPYLITYLSGPYELSGIAGHLRLTFYNDRLMEADFSPENEERYLTALRSQNSKVPGKPAEEVVLDRRTKFRFDAGPEGKLFFTWYDPKLENEWNDWVAKHS
jgi:hypothetical protein